MGLSPKEEFSPIATLFEINNSQHIFIKPNSSTSESFQHTESNKQRGSSPSLEEVMHDLKGHIKLSMLIGFGIILNVAL
ncbi:MAG: hypothetical protein EZS28_046768 [Streblomastix strix]|uniref:Uncharacterized protein n=1 Tax=Streblomastix strix TaxID=222440 RepID=A0A5J4TJQ8_9EUKA|nr:MAG: hypothetical protein EZS28_046768 [Streblomastix strix]